MRPTTLVRLALAGTRTDTARVVLTALSALLATLAGLAALTVLAIPTPLATDDNRNRWSEQYHNALLVEPGLRGGTAFALLTLMIPVLALAGQCARLGAPARDRRLAALRLAGATPGQVTRLVVVETGVAALLGTLVGLGVYLVGRDLLHRPDARGQLALPTDVLPSPGAVIGVVLGLPVVAALATALMVRKVTTSPLGVSRKAPRERGPGPWAGLLIGFGVVSFALVNPVLSRIDTRTEVAWLVPLLFTVGAFAAMIGVVIGTGWISYHCGVLLRRHARRASALLAAGRLMADPWAGSRTFAALLAALIFGGGAAAQRAYFATKDQIEREQSSLAGADGGANPFYLSTMDLVDGAIAVAILIAAGGLIVALVEGIVARRRAYAALVATGVPRATLGRSVAWQALVPAVPAILLALTVGTLLGRGMGMGREVSAGGGSTLICEATAALCDDPATRDQYSRIVYHPEVQRAVPVPLEHLAWLGAGALAAVLVTVGVGLLFLRASTALDELRTT